MISLLFITLLAQDKPAQEGRAPREVIYKYRQYEKFDLTSIGVEGEGLDFPRDVSVVPRYYKKYKNKLPYKYNFNYELRRSVERLK